MLKEQKMDKVVAKQQLVDALVADKEGEFSDWDEVQELLLDGFQGFKNMTAVELIQCAVDADLVRRNPTVAELVSILQA